MYFTVSDVQDSCAAQWTVMTAAKMAEQMKTGKASYVALESAIAALSTNSKVAPEIVAAQILNADSEQKKKAIRFGFSEMVRAFGSEENLMSFFRQVTTPQVTLRFEGVAGLREDLTAAKNRSAVMAMRAAFERYRTADASDFTPAEREYIEFLKATTRALVSGVDSGKISAANSMKIETVIREAGYIDQRPKFKNQVTVLQAAASREAFQEARTAVLARYKKVVPVEPQDPAIH